ncbi:MAG: YlxR family protein [Clostridia bacterium]|nr:YlxR family protein [Clostridia bacterium]
MKPRKIPMRMCVGCREMKPKSELIRVVKTPEDEIKLDESGKLCGRGAYICKSEECLYKAEKINALAKAFERSVSSEIYEKLREELKGIE